MDGSSGSARVREWRRNLKERGLFRLEVRVPREDADIIRDISRVLRDPQTGNDVRIILRKLALIARE